jgi:hypothetical protein
MEGLNRAIRTLNLTVGLCFLSIYPAMLNSLQDTGNKFYPRVQCVVAITINQHLLNMGKMKWLFVIRKSP